MEGPQESSGPTFLGKKQTNKNPTYNFKNNTVIFSPHCKINMKCLHLTLSASETLQIWIGTVEIFLFISLGDDKSDRNQLQQVARILELQPSSVLLHFRARSVYTIPSFFWYYNIIIKIHNTTLRFFRHECYSTYTVMLCSNLYIFMTNLSSNNIIKSWGNFFILQKTKTFLFWMRPTNPERTSWAKWKTGKEAWRT